MPEFIATGTLSILNEQHFHRLQCKPHGLVVLFRLDLSRIFFVRVYNVGCSVPPLKFAPSFTRLGSHFQERQARREPWSWPLQGSSVRTLNFCRHRNRGPRSASFQRPADNETRVVVPVKLPDGGVFATLSV